MTDIDPMMVLTFAHSNMVGSGTLEMDATVKPTPAQYSLRGDSRGMALASSAVEMENSAILVEVLELTPENQAEWPDWENRLTSGFLLCRYWTSDDQLSVDHLGWFSRVKILPLTEEQWRECFEWIKQAKDLEDLENYESPEWFQGVATALQDELSENSGNIIKPMTCGNCGGRNVSFHLEVLKKTSFPAGLTTREGDLTIVPAGKYNMTREAHYHLHCGDCTAIYEDFGEGKYHHDFPGLSLDSYRDKEWDSRRDGHTH